MVGAMPGSNIYNIESGRSPGYYVDDGGRKDASYNILRLTKATPGGGTWALFKFIPRGDGVYTIESVRSPGYYLDDGGKEAQGSYNILRLTHAAPGDGTWAKFKLIPTGKDNTFYMESMRSPGYYVDDGGKEAQGSYNILRLTHAAPGGTWSQFKLVLRQPEEIEILAGLPSAWVWTLAAFAGSSAVAFFLVTIVKRKKDDAAYIMLDSADAWVECT